MRFNRLITLEDLDQAGVARIAFNMDLLQECGLVIKHQFGQNMAQLALPREGEDKKTLAWGAWRI
jgi:hypothetical protein